MKTETALVIQEAMGVILARKLMDCFDRPEDLSTIQATNEFRVITSLQNEIDQAENFSGQSSNAAFKIISDLWNELHKNSSELTKNHYDLLKHIVTNLSIKTPDYSFLLGGILKHEKKIYQKINPEFRADFEAYVAKANQIIRDFRVRLLNYQAADYVDEFFKESSALEERELNFHPTTPSGTTIYLDLNAVASILSNKNIKKKCLAAIEGKTISFLHSSYVVEDIAVSNALFVRELIENLQELTKNHITITQDDEIVFATEDIYDTLKRVNLLRGMTRNFEHHRLITTISHYHDYPDFRRGETFYNLIAKDPIEFFRKDGEHKNSPALEFLTLKFSDKPFIQELIKNGSVDLSKNHNKKEAIEEILELCDFINFQTEAVKLSNASKIASSYRDNNHILHASVVDYFVSDDEKLRERASFAYRILGIPTKVIASKLLFEKIAEINKISAHCLSGEAG